MVRVVAAGHVNWDVTLRVDRLPDPDGEARIRAQRSASGGSAANVAAALAGLDVHSGIVGSVGDDQHGHLARRELLDAGVECSSLREVPDADTSVKFLLVDDDGRVAVLGNDGVNEAVEPDGVDPDYVRSGEHVHLTSQRPATAARIASIAEAAGLSVSFDPGRRLADREFGPTLALADLLFVNDREAEAILERAYPASDFSDRVFVRKRGEKGATVHTPAETLSHPGFDVEAVDTTGAGDAFAAGFLLVWLDDRDPERALEFGNACGAIAASRQGARTSPTRREVRSFLDGQWDG